MNASRIGLVITMALAFTVVVSIVVALPVDDGQGADLGRLPLMSSVSGREVVGAVGPTGGMEVGEGSEADVVEAEAGTSRDVDGGGSSPQESWVGRVVPMTIGLVVWAMVALVLWAGALSWRMRARI